MKLRELRERHVALCAEARTILDDESNFDAGKLKPEHEQRFDAIMADADAVARNVEREEKLLSAAAATASRHANIAEQRGQSRGEIEDTEENYNLAFRDYLRFGMEGVAPEFRSLFNGRAAKEEVRAQSVTGGSPVGIYGGYTVAREFIGELERAMKQFGGMLEVGRTIATATGATMDMPMTNDTGNVGAILGENQPVAEQDVTFTTTTLSAYKYTSKLIRVSVELLQDSAFNVEEFIASIAGERLGRILNTHLTTGTGSAQPQGIVTGSALGYTAAQQNSISYNDIVELQHSVDPAYRGNAWLMFNDSTLKILRKLVDTQNRPLWEPSLQAGVPSTFAGSQYRVNQDMASVGASAKTVLYGDYSRFLIRKVRDFTVVRLNERYMDSLQVGFFIFCRYDSKVWNAGGNPLKYLAQKAASP